MGNLFYLIDHSSYVIHVPLHDYSYVMIIYMPKLKTTVIIKLVSIVDVPNSL